MSEAVSHKKRILSKSDFQVALWLLTGALMIYFMLVIGGITRLTGSGLSMMDWRIIGGTLPPLSQEAWQEKFELYKTIPQYEIINKGMTLDGFKSIFWWEYIHRVWGRLIGIVFMVPFLIFLFQKKLKREWLSKLLIVFLLGAAQGILGWVMVSSGFDLPWVSPYRLTAHLLLALFLYAYLWVFWIQVLFKEKVFVPIQRRPILILLVIVALQLFYGGFMSGTKAALYYPTFPDMNGQFMPKGMFSLDVFWRNFFENTGFVQFTHRLLAYAITGLALVWGIISLKKVQSIVFKRSIYTLFVFILVQVLLGVLTVLYSRGEIPVLLGVLHQVGAVLVFSTVLWLAFRFSYSK